MSWNIVEDLAPKAQRDKQLMGKAKADIRQKMQAKKDKRKGKPSRRREVK